MARRPRTTQANARIARGWSLGFYIAGVAALGAGLLVGGIVAAATGSAAGLTVAAIIAGLGTGTGALGLWESRRFRQRAQRLERTISEQRLYALASQREGVLRVADVARELGVSTSEAEALLDHTVDQVRVSMEVTDDGEIHYVFREALPSGSARVRVEVEESELAAAVALAEAGSDERETS